MSEDRWLEQLHIRRISRRTAIGGAAVAAFLAVCSQEVGTPSNGDGGGSEVPDKLENSLNI